MSVQGADGLRRRLEAIGDTQAVMKALQMSVVREAHARVPKKTGDLYRSIVPADLTPTRAKVVAAKEYARYVEEGTGVYGPKKKPIVPKKAKALRWYGNARLSGRARTDPRNQSTVHFARSVKGRRATPFLEPGARAAASKSGLKNVVVTKWNEAD